MAEIFRVAKIGKGYLAVMARPGLFESLRQTFEALAKLDIGVVVSLLEEDEARDLGLADERIACASTGMEFLSFPIKDHGLPSDAKAVSQFSKWAHARIVNGCGWVFHCHAGIGRSGMMAASVLLQEGYTVHQAFACISAARGLAVPDTLGQLEWVERNYEILRGNI
jgi:protein-tyrosine phosphatase